MSYTRFQPMIESASTRPQIWRLVAGFLTMLGIAIAWAAASLMAAAWAFGGSDRVLRDFDISPFGTALFLFTIIGLGVGTWCAAALWQGRSLGSLTGRGPVVLRDFVKAAGVTWVVAAVGWLAFLPFTDPLVPNMAFADWLRWLPVALVLILFQTGAEELLFRGYLQSQLAARFKSQLVWLMLPALLFGAGHFVPSDTVAPGLIYVGATMLFGVIAGDLTARTGSIGAAWGFHFANNCLAILLVVYIGAGSGLGLYSAGQIEDALQLSPLLVLDLAVMVVVWLAIRRVVTA